MLKYLIRDVLSQRKAVCCRQRSYEKDLTYYRHFLRSWLKDQNKEGK